MVSVETSEFKNLSVQVSLLLLCCSNFRNIFPPRAGNHQFTMSPKISASTRRSSLDFHQEIKEWPLFKWRHWPGGPQRTSGIFSIWVWVTIRLLKQTILIMVSNFFHTVWFSKILSICHIIQIHHDWKDLSFCCILCVLLTRFFLFCKFIFWTNPRGYLGVGR